MDPEFINKTRKSLHQLNNDLSIASMSMELIAIKLEREPDNPLHPELLQSCRSALDAVRRAADIANQTLHDLH